MITELAIDGIVLVLVIMLFTFNLTVTNGIINTLIFYVNIININYSQIFDINSPDCTLLSLLKLYMGNEICFYNTLDVYTKMWLQLAFPFYLMLIAFTLMIKSQYCSKLLRIAANTVIKYILATLLLLCYTIVLLKVRQALFFSSVTSLPSKQTTLVQCGSTSVIP